MNPEEGMRRLNDPEEWDLALRRRSDVFPPRKRWSPWAVSLATIAAVAAVGVIVFAAFGLSVQNVRHPLVPAVPTGTSATSTPSPTVTDPPAGVAPTCESLLDKDTLAAFASQGLQVTGDDYTTKVVEESAGSNRIGLATFVKYGGIICGWGGGSENALMYGFGPISSDQAADAKARIQKKGYSKVAGSPYERYDNGSCDTGQTCGGNSGYAFGDGWWAYFYNNGGGVVLDEVVRNGAAMHVQPPATATPPATPTSKAATPAKPPYLTSEGLGDLRIGQKISGSSAFATWGGSQCSTTRWGPSAKYRDAYEVVTQDSTRQSPLAAIVVRTDKVPTKSGVRVGDSLATLLATYPKFDSTIPRDGFTLYVIKGSAGQVVFEVSDATEQGSYTANTVAAISVFPSSIKASDLGSVFHGDAWSPCGQA